MPGSLFTEYFLTDGIKATDEWRELVPSAEEVGSFRDAVRRRYGSIVLSDSPNEAVTEQEIVRPVLEALGWADYLPQQGSSGNEDIPDHLLFADTDSKERAGAKSSARVRYKDALVVEESKRLGRSLDARGADSGNRSRTPHGQILGYLTTADVESDGRIRWGILTNGGVWRLYDHLSRPRATGYFEVDLENALEPENEDALRAFYLLFRRESFILQDGAVATFLEAALAEGKRYEAQVAQDLSSVVFTRVFPSLVNALAEKSGEDLPVVRQAALIFLYRLLFVLYAEDRGLLPVNDTRYDDYGMRKPVRDHVAVRMAGGDVLSDSAARYYNDLMTLCRLIDMGDASIGLPPYNGGLFAPDAAPLLGKVELSDKVVAPIVYDLSHTETKGERRFVNYRDMSVQQLGSIYERLLEQEPVRDDGGAIVVRPNPYARKDSGSFFTPQELVDLIVDRTVKPLVEERLEAFEKRAAELSSDRRPRSERLAELVKLDPAEAALDLKILDPAMGSGHFLVTAVDTLSDWIAERVENPGDVPEWMEGEYVSPLVERVEAIRQDIIGRARESDWALDESQLTDQTIIRRMVLKRCIYGVDKNALTVELAKVSLWLHSFTVGAPLSFLDHHLRCGDSLIGLRVTDATSELNRLGGLFASSAIAGAEAATSGMQRIEEMSDADVSEVRESASLFREVEGTTADLRGLLDFLCGLGWLTAGMKKTAQRDFEAPLLDFLAQNSQSAYELLARGPGAVDEVNPGNLDGSESDFEKLWGDARSISEREGFLHWEVAFPGVWRGWQDARPQGGFDAVIGNPPWDRIKLQEVEWFATRAPRLALAPTAAARRALIRELREQGDPLVDDFDAAKKQADGLGQLVRRSGDYPLLGGGDINLYSLFVERAMGLVKPDGFVGLLTPSGIYADKTAARFFKSVSTVGRVSGLFDFENRKIFFKDVHASFKFCVLAFGGEERRFPETECAFFLHDTDTINDSERCFPLAPDDFTRVNPNTGTAPVFRSRRDADITRRIYERHPVLVDRSGGGERKAWPVRYNRMFDMTNDSHLFRTGAQLDAEGFYPVEGNRWKRGDELYLPLYQGRMIHQFDHRANSVRFNPESTHNPYLSEPVSDIQHADPKFLPQTQYWVPAADVEPTLPKARGWTLGFRNIGRPTDERTIIATLLPYAGFGNSTQLLLPAMGADALDMSCLAANLSNFVLDFVASAKVQGANINWFIVEQLPVIAPDDYDRQFGDKTAREIVREHVLELTYTAHDMEPFARDLGYKGRPFVWDDEDRRHLRARLDALYFHLYGLSREDAGYVMDTFPIVRREDEAKFGRYRTREMVLAYMNALSSGDTGVRVGV